MTGWLKELSELVEDQPLPLRRGTVGGSRIQEILWDHQREIIGAEKRREFAKIRAVDEAHAYIELEHESDNLRALLRRVRRFMHGTGNCLFCGTGKEPDGCELDGALGDKQPAAPRRVGS